MGIFKPKTAIVPGPPPSPPPPTNVAQYLHLMIRVAGQPFQPYMAWLVFDDPTWPPVPGTWSALDQRVYFSGFMSAARYGWGVTITLQRTGMSTPEKFRLILAPDAELEIGVDWPAAPPRDVVCAVNIPFQGLTATTEQFGSFPMFGPETSTLHDLDLAHYFDQVKAAGGTHIEFAVSWNYRSPTYQYPVPGTDLSQNLPELKRRIELAIRAGFSGVLLFCAGDGLGAGPGYNDLVGWTYGYDWLMANFARIYNAMGPTADSPHDCRPWIIFLPGYDGTDSYGWETADRVVSWWNLARGIIDRGGAGYLGQEWSAGHCQVGGQWDGEATYINGPARALDVILQEFPASPPMPTADPSAVWQMVGRMVSPYHRDPAQTDDPNPPYYLRQGTPRGPYFYVAYEYDTYHWVRGRVSADQVQKDREYLRKLGCALVC